MHSFYRFSLPDIVEYHLPEHQVLINFWDDLGAEAFDEWFFNGPGSAAFAKWCAGKDEYKGLLSNEKQP